ncbi:hypothetical protein ACSSV4_001534 [Roseovarius sp. MBR-154]|jgi:hypothetical protein
MKRLKLLTAAFALATVTGPALAQSFVSYDENSDGKITKDEFYGSVADAGIYADWDTNDDGLLDEEEFGALDTDWDYDTWDADANSYVDAGEFYDGYYSSYDVDESGHWDNGEWDDAGEEGLFDL